MTQGIEGKRIVVTGGAGFVGSHLIDRLIKEDPAEIIVVSNFSLGKMENLMDAMAHSHIEVESMDVSDKDELNDLFKVLGDVDVVFHLASIPLMRSIEEPEKVFREIIGMSLNLAAIQRGYGFGTLIQYSTSEVYGTAIDVPMNEDHPKNPTSPYAIAKLTSDHIALGNSKHFKHDVGVIRPFNLYGPRQHWGVFGAVIPTTIYRILCHQNVFIDGDGLQERDFTHVSDVVEATVSLYKNSEARGYPINVGSGQGRSIKEVVEKICEMMDGPKPIYRTDRVAQVRKHQADISLAQRVLGYEPKVGFEEGIEKTIQWYRDRIET